MCFERRLGYSLLIVKSYLLALLGPLIINSSSRTGCLGSCSEQGQAFNHRSRRRNRNRRHTGHHRILGTRLLASFCSLTPFAFILITLRFRGSQKLHR